MFLILITTTTAGITDQAVVVMSCLAAAAAVVSHQLHSEYLSPSGLCHTLGLWPFSWTTTPSSKWVFNSSLLLRVVCLFEFTLGFLTSAVCVCPQYAVLILLGLFVLVHREWGSLTFKDSRIWNILKPQFQNFQKQNLVKLLSYPTSFFVPFVWTFCKNVDRVFTLKK